MNAAILSILAQATELSYADQLTLNKLLVENIKRDRRVASIKESAKYNLGDTVMFDAGRTKGIIKMTVNGFSRDGSKLKGTQIGGIRAGCVWTVGTTVTTLRKVSA